MRIFDALNDIDNMKSTIRFVKESGGMTDCCVCYTVDPKFKFKDKLKGLLGIKKIPPKIFTIDYFVNKAIQLEKLGADMISIKDMAGLIPPEVSLKLMKSLKKNVKVPIDLHTHCTPGFGLASVLNAMVYGADIVDTVIWNFAGGPAAPAFELIQIFCDKLGYDTGVNLDAVSKINKELKEIRKELSNFDEIKIFPIEFDIANYSLSNEVNKMFDEAISASKSGDSEKVTYWCQEIEKNYNFPPPDNFVKDAEIPGGMYTNMLSQLKQANLSHMLNRVLEVVPTVRLDSGLPPLVTPTSQIVGVQAVYCVIDESKGKPFYDNTSMQYVNLVKGVYGKTPYPVSPEFREKIAKVKKEMPYDVSKYKKQENPELQEFEDVKLASNEKEELLLELFPAVASGFLRNKREVEFKKVLAERRAQEEIEMRKIKEEQEAFNKLSKEEKDGILMEGLYNNW